MASAGSSHQPARPAAGANPAKTPAPSTAGRPSATVTTISRGLWVTGTHSQMRHPAVTTRSTDTWNGRIATVSNCQRHGLRRTWRGTALVDERTFSMGHDSEPPLHEI